MAEKAKKSTKTKKPATKTTKTVKKSATTTIKSSVTGKKKCWDKPGIGKIICLCVVVVSLIVIIVATMLNSQPFSGNFFTSDDTKYVLNMVEEEDNEDNLAATHIVYYYKDDDITGAQIYYEFKSADDAKKAFETLSEMVAEDDENNGTYELNGKYIIVTADEEEYGELTVSEIKSYIELYESMQNGEIQESTDDTEDETEEE